MQVAKALSSNCESQLVVFQCTEFAFGCGFLLAVAQSDATALLFPLQGRSHFPKLEAFLTLLLLLGIFRRFRVQVGIRLATASLA